MSVCLALSLDREWQRDDDQTLSKSRADEMKPVLVVCIKRQLC
jgi:hypothetical protein